MTKFWSVTRETRKESLLGGAWVKVVGSNPADPTKIKQIAGRHFASIGIELIFEFF
jgi:hypothetical protein